MENKMMAMRVALRDVSRVAEEMSRGTMTGESVDMKTLDAWAMRLCEIISRDLAIPLRNCDVGTAEEQYQRWRHFCEQRLHRCDNCPCNRPEGCTFTFENMPYESKEGGAQ